MYIEAEAMIVMSLLNAVGWMAVIATVGPDVQYVHWPLIVSLAVPGIVVNTIAADVCWNRMRERW